MNNPTKIYCAYDPLNPPIDKTTGEEIHICGHYNTMFCTFVAQDMMVTGLRSAWKRILKNIKGIVI